MHMSPPCKLHSKTQKFLRMVRKTAELENTDQSHGTDFSNSLRDLCHYKESEVQEQMVKKKERKKENKNKTRTQLTEKPFKGKTTLQIGMQYKDENSSVSRHVDKGLILIWIVSNN